MLLYADMQEIVPDTNGAFAVCGEQMSEIAVPFDVSIDVNYLYYITTKPSKANVINRFKSVISVYIVLCKTW